MKNLTLVALSAFFAVFLPIAANAHPGHDQNMTFVHAYEAMGIVLVIAVAAGIAIHYLTSHKD